MTNSNETTVTTVTETTVVRGMTKEEILLSIDIALAFFTDADGKVKEGNLPAGLIAEFNRNKLGRLLELTDENRQLWWAVNEACRACKGGAEYKVVEKAFRFLKNRFTSLAEYYAMRRDLFAEIERLGLDPSCVDNLHNDEIADRLEKVVERRKTQAIAEVREILRMVNMLEERAGLSERSEVDLDNSNFAAKSDLDAVKKELLDRKVEVEYHLRNSLGDKLKKHVTKAA